MFGLGSSRRSRSFSSTIFVIDSFMGENVLRPRQAPSETLDYDSRLYNLASYRLIR